MSYKKIKQENKKRERESKIVNFKIYRTDIEAESENAILIKIEDIKVWVNKKYVFKDDFTLKARIGIINEFTYKGFDKKRNLIEVDGSDLIEMLENDIVNELND